VSRLPDWLTRLGALVASRLDSPFVWGRNDCCLWAADAVQAVTGVDLAADLRGTYRSQRGALRTINRAGGLAALCDQRLGPEVRPTMAQVGDVGLVDEGAQGALVVNLGLHWMGYGAHGLQPVMTDRVMRAWRCSRG
jgi:hypothetical protein